MWYVLNQHMMTLLHQYLFLILQQSDDPLLAQFGKQMRLVMVKCLKLTLPVYAIETSIITDFIDDEVGSLYQHCQKDPEEVYSPLYYSGPGSRQYVQAILLETVNASLGSFRLKQLQKRLAILRYAKIHGEPKVDFERRALVQVLYQSPIFYLPTKCAHYFIDACLRQGLESMLSDHYSGWWQRVWIGLGCYSSCKV